ncbi:MAG: hypothetical protein U5J63_07075 [Fodinibius sp.]|nr:hypothetical protein [Fodinibius sp.]
MPNTTSAGSPATQKNEVGFSMMMPMGIMALGLLIVGIFNAYIVEVIVTMFPAGF